MPSDYLLLAFSLLLLIRMDSIVVSQVDGGMVNLVGPLSDILLVEAVLIRCPLERLLSFIPASFVFPRCLGFVVPPFLLIM